MGGRVWMGVGVSKSVLVGLGGKEWYGRAWLGGLRILGIRGSGPRLEWAGEGVEVETGGMGEQVREVSLA